MLISYSYGSALIMDMDLMKSNQVEAREEIEKRSFRCVCEAEQGRE